MVNRTFKWILSLYIALVFIQSLFFKFTDSYETMHIFGVLGDWAGLPWFSDYGGYGVGVVELIASILLLTSLRLYGAIIASGVMAGAVFFHLFTPLGVKMPEFDTVGNIVGDDGGLLFYSACGVLVASLVVTWIEFVQTDNVIKRAIF